MSQYIINGGKKLVGEVSLRGAKNAGFKKIIASLLTDQTCHLKNLPQISDIKITQGIAKSLGAKIQKTGQHSISIHTPQIDDPTVPSGTGKKSRASFIFAAPLLARCGRAIIPLPGGDRLGARPLNRLVDAFSQMNIQTDIKKNSIFFHSSELKPTTYTFPQPSHTTTEVLIMIASLIPGITRLNNTSLEPEIDDMILMLNNMGAKIERNSENPKQITIKGVKKLKGTHHQTISDRNEAVTFACAALATKGQVNILRIDPSHIKTFLDVIEQMGASVDRGQDEVTVKWVRPLKACQIATAPEPGFMTDWQAVFSILLTQAIGSSTIIEKVFPYRFHHLAHLQQMGAKIKLFNPIVKNPQKYYHFNPESDRPEYFHAAKIYGPCQLKPIKLHINDLRSGACLTLAALIANGQSTISGVEYIARGYEKLAERLCYLGADICYIKTKNRPKSPK